MSWSGRDGDNNRKRDPIPSFLAQPHQQRGAQQPYEHYPQDQPQYPHGGYGHEHPPQRGEAPRYEAPRYSKPSQSPPPSGSQQPVDYTVDTTKYVHFKMSRGTVAFMFMFLVALLLGSFGTGYIMGRLATPSSTRTAAPLSASKTMAPTASAPVAQQSAPSANQQNTFVEEDDAYIDEVD